MSTFRPINPWNQEPFLSQADIQTMIDASVRKSTMMDAFIVTAITVGAMCIGVIVGTSFEQHNIFGDAIKHGAGHYAPDKTGREVFRWSVCEVPR